MADASCDPLAMTRQLMAKDFTFDQAEAATNADLAEMRLPPMFKSVSALPETANSRASS